MRTTRFTTGSSSSFQLIIDAISSYAERTGIDLTKNPYADKLLLCDSSDGILELLEGQAKAFNEYRDGNRKLIDSLKPAVQVLHVFSGFLGEAVSLVPFPPAKAIFVGIGVLLVAASGVSASYDALVDLFECIENFLKRLHIYTEIPPNAAMTEIIVKIMVELLSVLALATKQIKQGRFKKFAKKLLGESEVEAVLQRLGRLTQEEARMTVAQTLEVVHGLVNNMRVVMEDGKASTDNIRQALVTMQQIATDVNKMKRDQLQREVQRWLAPPDPSSNHDIVSDAHHPGTAAWFFQKNIFTEWKAKGSLLWIHGKPGSGKSTLLSAIIQDVEDMCNAGLASMAYYYFDFRDIEKQNRYGLLSSLVSQLSAESDSCYDFLSRLISSHAGGTRKPTGNALTKCLKDMLRLPGQGAIYIIVDALDECPDTSGMSSAREKVLELVEELVNLHLPNVHLLVTSRPEIDIRTVLEPLTSLRISLHEESGQRQDMIDYISSVVHSDREMGKWREEDQKLVIDTLSEKANGMFRWVVCQMETLRRSFPASIRRTLVDLPRSLDETYRQMLLGIDEEKREYAQRLFQCLTVSVRPLRLEELAEILAIRFDAGAPPEFNADWRPVDAEKAVFSACSSLISTVNVDGWEVVQFSHFSVKEFLISDRLAAAGHHLSFYHVLPEPAHTILVHASLSVLLQLDDRIDRNRSDGLPLASYAAQHWIDHARFGNVTSRIPDAMERLFDPEKPHFAAWVWLYDIDRPWVGPMSEVHPTQPAAVPLYYATLCGFRGVVEHLIGTHPFNVNSRGGSQMTPLHAASGEGHLEVALLLLKHGADVNARDDTGLTPLHKASRSGYLGIVRSLIDHGADIEPVDEDHITPLHSASALGRVEIVRFLLEHGADVNHWSRGDWKPLHYASEGGHADVMKLLLDYGADVQAREKDESTSLHLATQHGDINAAQLLLQNGADTNAVTNQAWAPLHVASRYAHGDVTRLLLSCGADVNAAGRNGQTSLHLASMAGHLDVAQLLLEYGADVNALNGDHEIPWDLATIEGKFGVAQLLEESTAAPISHAKTDWSPLHTASRNGDLYVVRSLLDHGEDVDVWNRNQQTPLILASGKGRFKVAEFLLESGADVNLRDKKGWTALHIASRKGYVEVILLLLKHGADANAQSGTGKTPLDQASGKGHLVAVHMLINYGADITFRDTLGLTPLHTASQAGCLDVVQSLLERGADVNAKNKSDQRPLDLASDNRKWKVAEFLRQNGADTGSQDVEEWTLHRASERGRIDVVESLLECGEDINARNRSGKTALDLASCSGQFAVAQLLLNWGANVNSRSMNGWTPLHWAAAEGHLDIVRLLHEHGANINAQTRFRWTPLHGASRYGYLEVARFLLQQGANAYLQNEEGRTPLQEALKAGWLEIVQLLSATPRGI